MTIRNDLEAVIRGELDDCERALKREDPEKALRELRDAIDKLTEIARKVGHLERAARN
ncbi:MAG: hypothetical protein KIT48_11270 [Pseudolabrys sp.]|nr:hypothetical protein [Pseudolabrys sp.]